MTQSLAILGRQPALGLAELESLLSAKKIRPFGAEAALIDTAPEEIPFSRLGGTVKLAKVLHEFSNAEWQDIHEHLTKVLPDHLKHIPDGEKLQLGISTYGLKVSLQKQLATGLALKKLAKQHKQSVRIIPNKAHALSSAQVLHNKLFTPSGWELILIQDRQKTILAITTKIQDIEAYTARDQKRPKRDAKVGMLPPKLAQIIVNLATGTDSPGDDGDNNSVKTILDPFCGTGVILQESLLMGYNAFGTDTDLRMVQYTSENIEWLQSRFNISGECHVTVGDATTFDWKNSFDVVAAETYLGRPFSSLPDKATVDKVMSDVNTIHVKFLQNLSKQTEPGTRICLGVPAWKTKDGFLHLKILDSLEKLGYTRLSFAHAANEELIYHREGQVVGRELIVLQRT